MDIWLRFSESASLGLNNFRILWPYYLRFCDHISVLCLLLWMWVAAWTCLTIGRALLALQIRASYSAICQPPSGPKQCLNQYSSPQGCWCYQSLHFTGGETEAQEEGMAPSQGHSYKVIVKSGFELRTFDPKIFVHNLSTVYTKLLNFCDLKSYISFCCYPFSFLKNWSIVDLQYYVSGI